MLNIFKKKRFQLSEEDRKAIKRIQEEIRFLEEKYGMSSEEFLKKWRTSTEPLPVEAAEANLWATHYAFVGKES